MADTREEENEGGFDLVRKLSVLKPKNKEPRTVRVLDSWIAHAENDMGIDQGGRLGWLIASTVATAKLQQTVGETGASRFALKGGTLLQHKLGLDSRATKDLDGIITGDMDDFLDALDDVLAEPWGPINFARTSAELIHVPTRIVKPRKFELLLSLRGDMWRRVKVEIAPDEGKAGSSQEHVTPPELAGFGLPTPEYLVGMAMSYQIAQKVHAATNPHNPPLFRNERPRDVVDLVLLRRLVENTGSPSLEEVREAIRDIFASRANEARVLVCPVRMWPARLRAYPHWAEDFGSAAASVRLGMSLGEAVDEVNRWLGEIDACDS